MVIKSLFKERKYKVKNNKLTKKKAKQTNKTYKHIGGQNNNNKKATGNISEEPLQSNETANQEYLNNSGNEESIENNNMNQEGLSNNPETENENSTQTPAVGLYNNLNKQQPETELSKAIQKERGGLFISYPPEINGDKEKAIAAKLNLTNSREAGFTSYRGEMDDKIEPKFKIDNFYPKYLSYYKLSENTQNTPSNNMGNMEDNMSNMESNNPNTPTQSSA
jgi:hypothetical protein